MDPSEMLSIVFGSILPEKWKYSNEAAAYVDELSGMGIDKLAREPERLHEEQAHILNETRGLAFHNYKTFIETAECSKEVFQDFQSVEQHLAGLLDRLPEFGTSCQSLGDAAKDINARRRVNSLTLARHTQLLEILEIPQLMDTCVRNNYYEEALELSSYVRQMKQKFSSITIVADIVAEVDACSQLMLQQLLQQLRGPIQLPACLKIIGYLRRLEVFSEIELRLKFLQARDAWFQSQVNSVPTDNAYQHISKVIELCRVYIFDVITQYRAIFSDDSEPLLRNASTSSSASSSQSPSASGIFHSWLINKVSWFLAVLRVDLKAGVGSRLDSLLGQCMYFGLSLGRIGTDFRALLPPLFQEAAITTFRQNIDAALSSFRSALSHYTLASSIVLHSHSNLLSSTLAANSRGGSSSALAPNQLLEFPPLASLSNGIMGALNELRPCAPLAIAPSVTECLEQCLLSVAASLQSYYQTESSAITANEMEVFSRLCSVFVLTLVPLVQSSLDRLFPADALLHAIGQLPTAASRDSTLASVLVLNVQTISAPISDHLASPEASVDVTEASVDVTEALAVRLLQVQDTIADAASTAHTASTADDTSTADDASTADAALTAVSTGSLASAPQIPATSDTVVNEVSDSSGPTLPTVPATDSANPSMTAAAPSVLDTVSSTSAHNEGEN